MNGEFYFNGLKDSIENQLAKKAEEQEIIAYSLWMESYLFLQHPFFIPILLPINLPIFLLVKLIVWFMGSK